MSLKFTGQSILTTKGYSVEDLEQVFHNARKMRDVVRNRGATDLLSGKVVARIFYEPSTRTGASFDIAAKRLGAIVHNIDEVRYSSVSKGEDLADTVRTLERYADVLVMRHPELGSVAKAADCLKKPIINAGDGPGEHPTQAMLDLFTIIDQRGSLEGLNAVMLGDLKYGRTVHALLPLLALYGATIHLVSPSELKLPPDRLHALKETRAKVCEHAAPDEVLPSADVLYVTRVQKERFVNQHMSEDEYAKGSASYESLKGSYVIDRKTLRHAKKDCIIMHPFPRVDEIAREVDDDPRARYFTQIENGMYVRMALLAMVLGKT